MKKLLSLFLTLVFLTSFVSCVNKNADEPAQSKDDIPTLDNYDYVVSHPDNDLVCYIDYDFEYIVENNGSFFEYTIIEEPEDEVDVIDSTELHSTLVKIRIDKVFYDESGSMKEGKELVWDFAPILYIKNEWIPVGSRYLGFSDGTFVEKETERVNVGRHWYYIGGNEEIIAGVDVSGISDYNGISYSKFTEMVGNIRNDPEFLDKNPYYLTGDPKDTAPENYEYISTYEYPIQGIREEGLEDICEYYDLVEFVVTDESKVCEYRKRSVRDEEMLNEKAYTEEQYQTLLADYRQMIKRLDIPVKYYRFCEIENRQFPDFEAYDYITATEDFVSIAEIFPIGSRFLAFVGSAGFYTDLEGRVPYITEYVMFIDENDELVPVYNIPELEEYTGMNYEEFIKLAEQTDTTNT